MGDASTLSILQLIRIIVESTAGTEVGSPFIDDPKRHRIMENIVPFPDDTIVPCPLPDRESTTVLVESYFVNVGILLLLPWFHFCYMVGRLTCVLF